MNFKKLFQIPGPADLGMSKSNNAMPSRYFPNGPDDVTWEDYYERIKKDYPVRGFFAVTLPEAWRALVRKMTSKPKAFKYWLVSHLVPSRRYHMLDLRQPSGSVDEYRYGWIDTDWQMVYALFNLLVRFVEKEAPSGYFVPSEEDAAKDTEEGECNQYTGLKRQLDNHKEYMAIYKYWKTDRRVTEKKYADALSAWSSAHQASKGFDTPEVKKLWEEMNSIKEQNDKTLENMLHRLIKVRHCLWT